MYSDFILNYNPPDFPLSLRDAQEIARVHRDLQLHSYWFPEKFYIGDGRIIVRKQESITQIFIN